MQCRGFETKINVHLKIEGFMIGKRLPLLMFKNGQTWRWILDFDKGLDIVSIGHYGFPWVHALRRKKWNILLYISILRAEGRLTSLHMAHHGMPVALP